MMNKVLTVYKASAGSGKTFTLATEYIRLLIENPDNYRKILAVTFTNKATEEMKMRILSQLYGIANQLPDSDDYVNAIIKRSDNSLGRKLIVTQAKRALTLLLHNFNYFRVETIDSFFQSVLRNLARELDLTPNLRIGLNDQQVEEQAVDEMIENLDQSSEMLQLLYSFIMDNISDDKSWNVIWQIKKFGKTIFKDFYKDNSEQLNRQLCHSGFLADYISKLHDIKKKAKETMTTYSEAFFDALDENGLGPESLKGGQRGISSYFRKLKSDDFSDDNCMNATLASNLEDPSAWVTKSNPDRNTIISIVTDSLYQILQGAESIRSQQWKLYKSADATLANIKNLSLLNSIEQKVRQLNDDAGRFLLSDTQQLLHGLIEDSDSPFIFEKIGSRLEHIMIDEFQDTSTVQWQNFKILLLECMSHNTENLIVGDVKQSIYRWRSGDWRLLNNIDRQFANHTQQLEIKNLETNYRSQKNIIDFNNCFFSVAADKEYIRLGGSDQAEAIQLKNAYHDVRQEVPEKRKDNGLVSIALLSADDYDNKMLVRTLDTVKDLLDHHIQPQKIAIILRKNEHISLLANYLSQNLEGIKIVSDEAFRLDASIAVQIIVQAMHLITHPDDILAKAFLVKAYQNQMLGNHLTDNQLYLSSRPMDDFLPVDYVTKMDSLKNMSLYDLAEYLYAVFETAHQKDKKDTDNQGAYICAFFDQVSSFMADNSTDIDLFLEEWENNIHNKSIQSNEIDGIRLISIHKSKGLEFDNVIIPYCDWVTDSRDIIWCSPDEEPFSQLPIVPISYSKKNMVGTIYEADYNYENLQSTVDNLNLLYVAFTRASNNLFVFGRKKAKQNNRSFLIEASLDAISSELPGSIVTTPTDDNSEESDITFEYGTLCADDDQEKDRSDNVFKKDAEADDISIESYENRVEFKQSNKSRDFTATDDDDADADVKSEYIQIGNVLHHLFSTIHTVDDIDRVLKDFENDGILYDGIITRERLLDMVRKRLQDKRVQEWFSPRWTIFNECSIIYIDQETDKIVERRPDRVITDGNEMTVIDFKFGKQHDEYDAQVRDYMNLLSSMGHHHIKGYLWYVYTNQIKEVTV